MPQRTSSVMRATREPLGAGPSVADVVLRLAGAFRLICLTGDWAGGGALVTADPVVVLPEQADPYLALASAADVDAPDPDVVGGGWFGSLPYDGPHSLAFYDWVLRRIGDQWFFESLETADRRPALQERRDAMRALLAARTPRPPWSIGTFGGTTRSRHLAAVERGVVEIRAGEIYQVNVCTRLAATFEGEPAAMFAAAVDAVAPSRGAFVTTRDGALVSLSPELFLQRRGRDVLTAPIKGTRPRSEGDVSAADELRASVKDSAENVMIVDLMRNDLGRVCATGTVRPAALLDVEAHPGVWHLVSRVRGTLRDEVDDAALLHATFPPGSVTGAPKLRAVEEISKLEEGPRGAYTGAIGFVSPSWGTEFNVAIRTFEVRGDRVHLGVGGGITADSVPMLEWQECLHKAAPLLHSVGSRYDDGVDSTVSVPTPHQLAGGLLETVSVLGGRPVRLGDHLARLDRSCRELFGTGIPGDLAGRATAEAGAAGLDRAVLRLVARVRAGAVEVEVTCSARGPAPAMSAAGTIRRATGCWRHKWADRAVLEAAERAVTRRPPGPAVPLFVDADGCVLETSRGNVFLLRPDGTLVTPPLTDDVLPGITRGAVLDLARDSSRRVELRSFTVDEMRTSAAFWTSSLSLAVPIHAVDGVAMARADDEIAQLAAALAAGGAAIR